VSNTKVVQNILIWLHAKFPIFQRFQNIFFYFIFSSARKFKWKMNSKKGRASHVFFLRAGLLLQCLGPSLRASWPAPVTAPPSLTDGAHLSGPSSPNPPCSTPTCHRRPNSHRHAGRTSSARTTSLPSCPPVTVSRRIASSCCVASHRCCPLLCCRPLLRQPGCLRQELDDEASHSLPLCTTTYTCVHSWVGAVHWRPSLRRVDT
jgi:hypothetical protein